MEGGGQKVGGKSEEGVRPERLLLHGGIVDLVEHAIVRQEVASPQRRGAVGVKLQVLALQVCEVCGLPIVHMRRIDAQRRLRGSGFRVRE